MTITSDAQAATAQRWRPLYWARSVGEDGAVVIVEISTPDVPPSLWFLEHVFDRTLRRPTREVVARVDSMLYFSDDLGESWNSTPGPEGVRLSLCFTTMSGTRLLQEVDAPRIHVYDRQGSYLGARDAGLHPWHGSWSIDQASSGVIMFGEYAAASNVLHVHRSCDDGATWEPVFSQAGHPDEPAAGRIRHFHTCTADPYEPGRWYVSSGDRGEQNRLWRSDDDGLTWHAMHPELRPVEGLPIPVGRLRNVVRHTAEVVLDDGILWPTDDNLGSAARLVRLRKPELDTVEVLATFGRNELRNFISLEGGKFVVLSESKLDPTRAEVYVVTAAGRIEAAFSVANPTGSSAGFARSRSSQVAVDGTFFSFCDLEFDGRPRLLRWRIECLEGGEAAAERDGLRRRVEGERETRGIEDVGVGVLETAYRSTYCCNVCSPEIARAFAADDQNLLSSLHDPRLFTDDRQVEYPCPNCSSRIRQRTCRILVERVLANTAGRLLLVSTARPERLWFRENYDPITHITLAGDFGDPSILGGVDLRDMPQVPSESFDLMTASCVLDYIPELDEVAREAFRVLAPGGEFAFFIMPYRLVEGGTDRVVRHRNALTHETYAQTADGKDTGVPDCQFGTEFVRRSFADVGFEIEPIPVFDPLSRTSQAWYVATKPS